MLLHISRTLDTNSGASAVRAAFFGHVMRLPSEQPSGEIVWETEEVVQRAEMTALGQQRKSEATPGMSALGGEADVIRSKADIDLNSVNRRPFPWRLLARQLPRWLSAPRKPTGRRGATRSAR